MAVTRFVADATLAEYASSGMASPAGGASVGWISRRRPRCAAGAGGRGAPDYGCRPRRVRTQPRRNQDGRGAPEPRLSQARAQLPRAARKRPLTRAAKSASAPAQSLAPNDRGGKNIRGEVGVTSDANRLLPAHRRAMAKQAAKQAARNPRDPGEQLCQTMK